MGERTEEMHIPLAQGAHMLVQSIGTEGPRRSIITHQIDWPIFQLGNPRLQRCQIVKLCYGFHRIISIHPYVLFLFFSCQYDSQWIRQPTHGISATSHVQHCLTFHKSIRP